MAGELTELLHLHRVLRPSGMEKQRNRARVPPLREGNDTLSDALECQVEDGVAHCEALDRELVDADRQPWSVDVDAATPAVDAQTEAGLQKHEYGPRRPGLRQAC